MENNKLQIGVIGSWRNHLPKESYLLAENIGKEIAKKECILVTGGSFGVMESSMRGAKSENGITVGIIAGENHHKYEYLGNFIDVKISTGMGESGKVPVIINSCDGVIAVGGGSGTLTEISIAYHQGKPIVVMENSGDISDKLHKLLDNEGYIDSKKLVKINFANSAEEAVSIMIKEIKHKIKKSSDDYGPEHGKKSE
jgi:uncharacterized protein (TIGR00725 family)